MASTVNIIYNLKKVIKINFHSKYILLISYITHSGSSDEVQKATLIAVSMIVNCNNYDE